MRYMGGKARIAKRIAAVINPERGSPDRPVVEPFCGALNVTAALGGVVLASDAHPGLIALYNGIRGGSYMPPDSVTEHEYQAAKLLPDDSPHKAFVGFACCFGGKWFGGYANDAELRNYSKVGKSFILKKIEKCKRAIFSVGSYENAPVQKGSLVYCDPPYAGTTGFSGLGKWDATAFVERVDYWANRGAIVYVSEFDFPIGSVVWERQICSNLSAGINGKGKMTTEKLYRVATR